MTRNQIVGFGLAGLLSAGLFTLACGTSESEKVTNDASISSPLPVKDGAIASTVDANEAEGDGGGVPTCDLTQIKGATCPVNGFVCQKTCGPTNAGGRKTETCTDGVFTEGSCGFPAGNYACFLVSGTTPECTSVNGGEVVKATDPCDIDKVGACKPCTGYSDSTGTPKQGYCHCYLNPIQDLTTDAGPNIYRWTCGSVGKEWPCNPDGTSRSPDGTGCI